MQDIEQKRFQYIGLIHPFEVERLKARYGKIVFRVVEVFSQAAFAYPFIQQPAVGPLRRSRQGGQPTSFRCEFVKVCSRAVEIF